MIYLAGKGMSLMQLGLLESIFHVTSFLMEIPTGVVADLFGRRMSRLIGRLLSVISLVLIFTGRGFEAYAFAFVITAFSYNFESGAGEALVYDSLKQIDMSSFFYKNDRSKGTYLPVNQYSGLCYRGLACDHFLPVGLYVEYSFWLTGFSRRHFLYRA